MTPPHLPAADRFVIRRMNAAEQLRAGRKLRRIPQLLVGLIGYGASVMLLVTSGLGAASWSVLTEGISGSTGISFGTATNLIAVVVLVAWVPMRELPGLGTLLNVVLIGIAADATARIVPPPPDIEIRALYLVAGIVGLAFFDALYLGAQFGAGPRDGLMTGLVRLTRKPIPVIRTAIEVTVAATGWLLGGTIGIGTVLITVTMGPLVGYFLPRVAVEIPDRTTEYHDRRHIRRRPPRIRLRRSANRVPGHSAEQVPGPAEAVSNEKSTARKPFDEVERDGSTGDTEQRLPSRPSGTSDR
ncbi:YitT family protein [Nocardia jiangxiensis]|uniref:YitT family protein n=1 Tax=Nocardia jiangxiensis TaxID=282685 RepID=A0ABW6RVT6_9NOCA